MMRVGKAGYINCPGKLTELINNTTQEPYSEFYNGWWHHRWLVSREGNKLIFEQKNAIATCVKWSDDELLQVLNQENDLGYVELYWRDKFEAEEKIELSASKSFLDIKAFIDKCKTINRS